VSDEPTQTGLGGSPTATTAVVHEPERVPPAGEDIHLPPGTPIPLAIAVAITLILVGTTTDWLWTGIGLAIFLVALGLWIRDTIREVDHLPDEHGSPAHH
jgi:hypothetical protein